MYNQKVQAFPISLNLRHNLQIAARTRPKHQGRRLSQLFALRSQLSRKRNSLSIDRSKHSCVCGFPPQKHNNKPSALHRGSSVQGVCSISIQSVFAKPLFACKQNTLSTAASQTLEMAIDCSSSSVFVTDEAGLYSEYLMLTWGRVGTEDGSRCSIESKAYQSCSCS